MAYDPHEDFDYYTGEWPDESDPRNEPPGDPVGCIWAVRAIDWEPISSATPSNPSSLRNARSELRRNGVNL